MGKAGRTGAVTTPDPKATFYRYRREFLKHGIDIAIRQSSKAIAQVPDWAVGTSLYFDPKLNRA